MSFKEMNGKFGPRYVSLSNDGESVTLAFVGEPVPGTSEFRGKVRYQALFPVATPDGLQIMSFGATMYRKIRDRWDEIEGQPVTVIRHGKRGDQGTTYEITKPEEVDSDLQRVLANLSDDEIADAIESARETADKSGSDETPF